MIGMRSHAVQRVLGWFFRSWARRLGFEFDLHGVSLDDDELAAELGFGRD